MLDLGDTVSDLSGATDGDGTLDLRSLRGQNVVVYFYPKDMTPGCTTEAQDFRDRAADFESAATVIVGVSKDPVKRHDTFKAKHDLPFSLVADTDGTWCETFGVWKEKKLYGRTFMGIERTTFLIDKTGVVRQVWRKVRVKGHVEQVLEAARAL